MPRWITDLLSSFRMACQAVAAADFSGAPAFVPRTGLQRGILRLRGAAAKFTNAASRMHGLNRF